MRPTVPMAATVAVLLAALVLGLALPHAQVAEANQMVTPIAWRAESWFNRVADAFAPHTLPPCGTP